MNGWKRLLLCMVSAGLALPLGGASLPVDEAHQKPASGVISGPYDWAKWQQFWSFRPVVRPKVPEVHDGQWARNDVDRFILSKLDQEGISPAPEADKLTLIRRATFDATGLPPTPQEVREFLADHSPDAYEKLVDRLVASPHYGERWGRHWLDVSRYVQSRITFPGVKNTLGDQAYRDYVVRSFNMDKPYDRFVTEQIAGDLLPPSHEQQQEFDQIAATAFLSIGPWFDQCTDPNRLKLDMIDDMINTTGQGILGLTVSCARCHDHKFDPIPTSDYYALAGIFGSTKIVGDFSQYWRDGRQRLLRPLAMPDEVRANETVLREISDAKSKRWNLLSAEYKNLMSRWQAEEPRYRAAADELGHPFIKRFAAENFDGEHNLRIAQLALNGRSVDVIETLSPTFQWVKYMVEVPTEGRYRLEALYSSNEPTPLDATVNGTVVSHDAFKDPSGGWELNYQNWATVCTCDLRAGLNFIRLETKQGSFPRLDRFRLVKVDEALDAKVQPLAASRTLNPTLLENFVKDPQQPWPTISGIVPFLPHATRTQITQLESKIAKLEESVKPYPTVVSVTDQSSPADMPVHLRGDVYSVSPQPVPRGVPQLFDSLLPRPAIAARTSGRLELAHWLTDRQNPLTARVFVNRLWQWHFGKGIVRTPSDFGSRGAPPTHPELLDYLADEFVSSGWSVKHVQRLIMTSATYRMSSRTNPQIESRDPENTLLSHFNRNRLDVEALYDTMASTTNIIVRQESGHPLDVNKDKNRAMYVLSSNRSPKGLGPEVRKMFELFDYDGSGAPIAQRPQSTTAAQSLFWLNSPLVKHFADKFAERLLKMDKLNDVKRVEMAYLLALGRSPAKEESAEALEYLADCTDHQKMDRPQAWSSFCRAIYGTVEFRYVD
ncbi:MAG TPA: DUF1549 domain-containing protein [Tepidisphaeraceae bacterium]|nr:DUF1549 domain-containing protein [Tepidisphaeraceae bacterium]